MGLDQQAYKVKKEHAISFTEIAKDKDGYEIVQEKIAYWRKHNHLHGWMENLYIEKGGNKKFNCVYVELTPQDLDNLESDVLGNKLPETLGFFCGNTPPDEEQMKEDLEFIGKAREAIEEGESVYYHSWW